MVQQNDRGPGSEEMVKATSLYREYRLEIDEIDRHKWLQSEKAGHDIGWDAALFDWIMNHRAAWLRHRRQQVGNDRHDRRDPADQGARN